jgi:hypothetical protein
MFTRLALALALLAASAPAFAGKYIQLDSGKKAISRAIKRGDGRFGRLKIEVSPADRGARSFRAFQATTRSGVTVVGWLNMDKKIKPNEGPRVDIKGQLP